MTNIVLIMDVILTRADIISVSVSVSGPYRKALRNIGYRVSAISKEPDIRYCKIDSVLARMVKYFHTSML